MKFNSTGSSLDLILYMAFIVVFLVFVYQITNFIGKKAKFSMQGKNMKVVEKLSLSMDKSLILVTISNVYYVLYLDKQGCTMIDKLENLELEEIKSNVNIQNTNMFSKLLLDKLQNYKKDKGE
ncbi:MAG: flagellar biosynthetic protein FliO [Acidaminobacteraceae bacterium]